VPFSHSDLNGLESALLDHRDTAPAPAAVIQESRVSAGRSDQDALVGSAREVPRRSHPGRRCQGPPQPRYSSHRDSHDASEWRSRSASNAAIQRRSSCHIGGGHQHGPPRLFFVATELRRIEPMKRQAERRAEFDVHRPQLGKTKLYEQYARQFPSDNKAATHQLRLDAPKEDDGSSPFFLGASAS